MSTKIDRAEFESAVSQLGAALATQAEALETLLAMAPHLHAAVRRDELQGVVDETGEALGVCAEALKEVGATIEALVLVNAVLTGLVLRQTGVSANEAFATIDGRTVNQSARELARKMLGAKPRLKVVK